MQSIASDWNSPLVPPTIRRPWRVFEEDVEDRVNESLAEGTEVDGEARQHLSACQARGARAAFIDLDVDKQQSYAEVSLMELSAYVSWRRNLVSQASDAQVIPGEFELKWDVLDCDAKAEWVPEDPRAVLASDAAWLPLLADGPPPCGPLQAAGTAVTKLEVNGSEEKAGEATPTTKLENAAPSALAEAAKPAQTVDDDGGDATPSAAAPPAVGKSASPPEGAAERHEAPAAEAAADEAGEEVATARSAAAADTAPAPKPTAAAAAVPKAPAADSAAPAKEAPAKGSSAKEAPAKAAPAKGSSAKEAPAKAAPAKGASAKEAPAKAAPAVEVASAAAGVAAAAGAGPAVPAPNGGGNKVSGSAAVAGALGKLLDAQAAASDASSGKVATPAKARKPSAGASAATEGKADAAKDNISTRLRSAVARGPAASATAPVASAAPGAAAASGGKPRGGRLKRLVAADGAAGVAVPAPVVNGTVPQVALAPGRLAPENLCPEALDAECIICGSSETCEGNDIGLCDRCDRAFHQQCHDPAVPYFGRPEDQWFCFACCEELAKTRRLRFRAADFVWAMFPPDPVPWPARVYRIDFASMNDPKPYWVQYYDAGQKTGAWLGDSQVVAWADGPAFGTLRDSRRRLAVRLAEAEGAAPISNDAVPKAPVVPLPKIEAKPPRAVCTPTPGRGRSSARSGPASQPRKKRSRRSAAGSDEEPDEDLASQVEAIRSMVAEARERQLRLEKELDEAAAATGLQDDGEDMVD